MDSWDRRRVLSAAAAVTAGLAGCSSNDGQSEGGAPTDNPETTVTVERTATETTTAATETTTAATTTTSGRFVVEDVTIEPRTPAVGDLVAVTVRVTNPGETAVTGPIYVQVDGRARSSNPELAPGEEITVTARFQPSERGVYDVRVDGTVVTRLPVGRRGYPMYKYGPANTGRGVGSVSSSPAGGVTVLPTPGTRPGGVVADAETVYVGRRGETVLTAVDLASGEMAWEADIDGYEVRVPPVVADGTLYTAARSTGRGGSRLRARSVDDGTASWDVQAGGVDGLAYANGSVYVTASGTEAFVYTVNADDGSVGWSTMLSGDEDRTIYHLSPPAVADGVVYASVVTARTGVVFAVDAASGDRLWTTELGGAGVSPPVVGADVYVRSLDGLHTLSRDDGSLGYSDELGPGTAFSNQPNPAPALADGTLFGCTAAGQVQALDIGTGSRRWGTPMTEDCGRASPVVVDGMLVVQTNAGTVVGFDVADGSRQFTVRPEGTNAGGPAFVAGSRLVATTTAGVHVYDVGAE